MLKNERVNLVAPCGIDCGICELYACKDDTTLYNRFIERGIPKDKIPCGGCRSIEGNCPVIKGDCTTYSCAQSKNIIFCYECDEFPCIKLHPAADSAGILPHNMKVFNLCTIRQVGVEGFISRSSESKKRYYTGKIQVGKGPQN